jgi:hypothetical protein
MQLVDIGQSTHAMDLASAWAHTSPVAVSEGLPSMFLGGVQVTSLRESGSLAVSSSTPFSVTSIVCSNCAERLPSCVWKIVPLDGKQS